MSRRPLRQGNYIADTEEMSAHDSSTSSLAGDNTNNNNNQLAQQSQQQNNKTGIPSSSTKSVDGFSDAGAQYERIIDEQKNRNNSHRTSSASQRIKVATTNNNNNNGGAAGGVESFRHGSTGGGQSNINGSVYQEYADPNGKNVATQKNGQSSSSRAALPGSPASTTSSRFNLRRAAIPLKEKFILNPWQKFKYYKRIPMKIFINILTIIVLTVFVIGYFADEAVVVRNERRGLLQFFLPDAADNTAASLVLTYPDIDGAISWIQKAAMTYYTIPDDSVGIWMHFADVPSWLMPKPKPLEESDYIVRPPRLSIRLVKNYTQQHPEPKLLPDGRVDENYEIIDAWSYFGGGDESRDASTETLHFDLNESTNYMGPFDPDQLYKYQDETQAYVDAHLQQACAPSQAPGMNHFYLPCKGHTNRTDFFDRILDMELTMQLRGVRRVSSTELASVVRWNINFQISFTAGRSLVKIQAKFKPYASNHFTALPMVTLSILVVLYCGCVVLYVRALWRYRRSNSQLEEILDDLNEKERAQFREKLAGFSWRLFGLVCAVTGITFCVLAAAVMSAKSSDEDLRFWRDLFLGLTYFFQCLLLLSHFQTIPEYYSGIKTVAFAIPLLIQFTLGIFPLFVGFSILFYVCFGPFAVAEFGTFSDAMCALYSASNGDSLLQFYTQISQAEDWVMKSWARIIFTIFLLYFCGHAQNIIMGIVQDSYLRVNETFELNFWDDDHSGSDDEDESSSDCSSTSSSSSCSSSSCENAGDRDELNDDDDDADYDQMNEPTRSQKSVKSSTKSASSSERAAKKRRRKERKLRRKQMGDLADPVAVAKLAKKLKKMRNKRNNVMHQIDQYYYLQDDDHQQHH